MTAEALDTTDHIVIDTDAQELLFRTARTANTFSDEPVTEDQIRALYDLVKWAPTALNAQPLRIVLIRTPEAKARLLTHLSPGNRAKSEAAPLVAILAADIEFHETLPEVFPHAPRAKDMFADATRRERSAREQAWLQAGYFIVGVRALGLAAGPMGGFDAQALDADLLAGTTLRSILVVNIGKPGSDAWFDRLPRLAYEDVATTL